MRKQSSNSLSKCFLLFSLLHIKSRCCCHSLLWTPFPILRNPNQNRKSLQRRVDAPLFKAESEGLRRRVDVTHFPLLAHRQNITSYTYRKCSLRFPGRCVCTSHVQALHYWRFRTTKHYNEFCQVKWLASKNSYKTTHAAGLILFCGSWEQMTCMLQIKGLCKESMNMTRINTLYIWKWSRIPVSEEFRRPVRV